LGRRPRVDKYRKIQIGLLVVLIIAIGVFSYLMYSWNLAYSKGTFVTDDGTYTGNQSMARFVWMMLVTISR